jgi:hypothetical protein
MDTRAASLLKRAIASSLSNERLWSDPAAGSNIVPDHRGYSCRRHCYAAAVQNIPVACPALFWVASRGS